MTEVSSEPGSADLAKTPTDIVVTAYPLDYTPFVYFSMEAHYKNGGGKKIGENLKFDKYKGEFALTFRLEDCSGLDLVFCQPVTEAIWVAAGPLCPTKEGTGGGTITGVSVKDKELIVTNTNEKGEMLSFALRFTKKASPEGPAYVYDPRIINGGR